MICGAFDQYNWHLNHVTRIIGGRTEGPVGALSLMILDDDPLFLADTHVHRFPSPKEVANIAEAAGQHV